MNYRQILFEKKILGKKDPPKEKKPMKRESDKKSAEKEAEREARGTDDTEKQKFFKRCRPKMVGICQCGCTAKSSKKDDMWFYASIAHIFPQRLFPSIQFHMLNWVERSHWEGCHKRMDEQSMSLWPSFADWHDIKERFHTLAPMLTDEERATKFYRTLEELVYIN